MEADIARKLEDWIDRTLPAHDTVSKRDLLDRAGDAGLPREAMALLSQLPEGEQSKTEIAAEVEKMTHVHFLGGSAGGTNAGSSGEMRPGAYGAEPDERYGGDQGGGYQP
jgi:hypothetical protein